MLGEDDEMLCDVVICTSGDGSVCINRNLGRDDCMDTIEAIVEGRTLIVTTGPGMLDEAAYLDHMTAAMQHLTQLWEADGVPPEEWVRRLQNAFQEWIARISQDDDDENQFSVIWNDSDGIQQERWVKTFEDAKLEADELDKKYLGVMIFDQNGNEIVIY